MSEENKPTKIGAYRQGEVELFGDTERLDVYYREDIGEDNLYRTLARMFAHKHGMVLDYQRTTPRLRGKHGPMLWTVYVRPEVRRDDSEIPPQRNVNELFTTDEEWLQVSALSDDHVARKQLHWKPF